MFHTHNNWFWERTPTGGVRLTQREIIDDPDCERWPVLHSHELTAEEWASVVASVSSQGETGETFRAALAFHNIEE